MTNNISRVCPICNRSLVVEYDFKNKNKFFTKCYDCDKLIHSIIIDEDSVPKKGKNNTNKTEENEQC